MGALSNNLSATNPAVKNNADVIVDLLVDTLENFYLIHPFVHSSIYGNPRSKPNIILHLNGN